MKKILIVGFGIFLIGIVVQGGFVPKTEAAPPSGFVKQMVLGNLNLPTDFAFAPDGRTFLTLKNGKVVVYKNGSLLDTPALSMTISTGGDRGLLSLALDPN